MSLAAKCRFGFAVAVLLIIGTALYLPFQWMNKLVEQSKRELGRAEVQHLLERHFLSLADGVDRRNLPPIALSTDALVRTAQYISAEIPGESPPDKPDGQTPAAAAQPSQRFRLAPIQVNPSKVEAEEVSLPNQPLTEWIPLPQETLNAWLEARARVTAAKETNATPNSEPPEMFVFPGDKLARETIDRFLRHDKLTEEFFLHDNSEHDSESNPGLVKSLSTGAPWGEPARYLQAIRAHESCLSAQCHGAPAGREPAPGASGARPFTEGQLAGVVSVILPAGQTGATLLFNRVCTVAGGILAGICAMVTFYLITQRFILEPVRRLRSAADKVTIPPEGIPAADPWQEALGITGTIKTGDEFERMAEAFHQMLSRLKLAQDRLRESNLALDLKVGELSAKNVALFEADKLKSEFLANVSHELRTPLNAIIGFAEILKEQSESRDDKKAIRYLGNVLEEGRLLLEIINNLLDLAKIEAGKVRVRWEKCAIATVIEAVVNYTRPLAEAKQLNITVEIAPSLGLVETDIGKLQQILFNLLSNAIKFTPPRGRVDINAGPALAVPASGPSGVEYFALAVTDTGPGIEPKDRERIFEKFQQLDASLTREHPGTGLGLAIVKELVEVLGGVISVGGEPGAGAVFSIILPMFNPAQAPLSAA